MEHEPLTKHPIRCFCSRTPLLAYFGMDKKNQPYVHTKVYKQTKLYNEVLYSGGVVQIRCRECLRWHKITFREDSAELEEVPKPYGA